MTVPFGTLWFYPWAICFEGLRQHQNPTPWRRRVARRPWRSPEHRYAAICTGPSAAVDAEGWQGSGRWQISQFWGYVMVVKIYYSHSLCLWLWLCLWLSLSLSPYIFKISVSVSVSVHHHVHPPPPRPPPPPEISRNGWWGKNSGHPNHSDMAYFPRTYHHLRPLPWHLQLYCRPRLGTCDPFAGPWFCKQRKQHRSPAGGLFP